MEVDALIHMQLALEIFFERQYQTFKCFKVLADNVHWQAQHLQRKCTQATSYKPRTEEGAIAKQEDMGS